jgi:hypothetical protein
MTSPTTEHVADRAGFLAALSPDDPERRAAEKHARTCALCRDALDEGARLVAVLQEALPLAPPSPAALSRAAMTIENETTAERLAMRRVLWASVAGMMGAWLFQLMVGSGFEVNGRQLAASLAVLSVAVGCVTLLRGRERLVLPVVLATSATLAFFSGTSSGLDAGIGIRCTFRELWAAVIPWAVTIVVARRQRVPLDAWNVAGVASAGALAAHAGQHLACQVPHAEAHLFAFHFSAVVLVTLVGAAGTRVRGLLTPRL